jgi:hypothetical protein
MGLHWSRRCDGGREPGSHGIELRIVALWDVWQVGKLFNKVRVLPSQHPNVNAPSISEACQP